MVTTSIETTASGSYASVSSHLNTPGARRVVYCLTNYRTAADSLPFVFNAVVTSGKTSALAFFGFYVIFIVLWLPFWLLSFLVTENGVYALTVCFVFFTGRSIIRLIAFPGASSKVSSEIESEFARYSVRMLVSACNCLLDLANAVISTSKGTTSDATLEGNSRGSSSFAYYEIPGLWKRAKSYRDRALGVYLDVLRYIYESSSQSQYTSNPPAQQGQRTTYGMNILSGDIGDLAGLTPQAREDGRELVRQLTKVLEILDKLAEEASPLFNGNSGVGSKTAVVSDEARNKAKELLISANELRDFVISLRPPPSDGKDQADEEEYNTANGIQNRNQGQEQNESAYEAVQSGLSSILPMIDPPPHTSIFGFDVQRGCMLSRYLGARQLWVQRPKGGMIDVIHIPAKSQRDSLPRNTKALLYCNPNAGLIEVAAGMSLAGGNVGPDSEDNAQDNSWVDFYTKTGYDVYIFNYAGFGRSYGTTYCNSGNSGNNTYVLGVLGRLRRIFHACFLAFKPTPDTLREDGETVANFLVGEAGVQSLVIHGESIGGVAASAAARQLSIGSARDKLTLLICDRTFCNLEAVAQRLVGGWAGYAIKFLAPFWHTDVAGDFIFAQCPKIVANDFHDNIVSDASSLKSGISIWREIRRGSSTTRDIGWMLETPLEYRMADWENVCVNDSQYLTAGSPRAQAPIWPSDKYISLEEAFHFAACVKRIGRMAKESMQPQLQLTIEEPGESITNLADVSGSSISAIFEVWKILAVCDGLCGAPLGAAVKNGFDSTVSWLCSSLTYGGQIIVEHAELRLAKENDGIVSLDCAPVIVPSDFDGRPEGFDKQESDVVEVHPKPIPEVLETIKSLLEGVGEEALFSVTHELKFILSMLEYIVARLSAAAVVESSWKCRHMKRDTTMVGSFLNLHCGHNNPFTKSERIRLKEILIEAGTVTNSN